MKKTTVVSLTSREANTILAALRCYQRLPTTAGEPPAFIYDVATNGGTEEPLLPDAIDDLCQHINCCESLPSSPVEDVQFSASRIAPDALIWVIELAFNDQDNYLSTGRQELDYGGEEWPEIAKRRAEWCRSIARASTIHGHWEMWNRLAARYEISADICCDHHQKTSRPITSQELNTILAALRVYQGGIDELCEALNCGGSVTITLPEAVPSQQQPEEEHNQA